MKHSSGRGDVAISDSIVNKSSMLDRISIPLSDGIAERHKARVTNHTSIFRHHHFGATLTMMMAAAAAASLLCARDIHKRRCLQWVAVKYFVIQKHEKGNRKSSVLNYILSYLGLMYGVFLPEVFSCNFFTFFLQIMNQWNGEKNRKYLLLNKILIITSINSAHSIITKGIFTRNLPMRYIHTYKSEFSLNLLQPLSLRFFKNELILTASQWSLLAFKSFFFD